MIIYGIGGLLTDAAIFSSGFSPIWVALIGFLLVTQAAQGVKAAELERDPRRTPGGRADAQAAGRAHGRSQPADPHPRPLASATRPTGRVHRVRGRDGGRHRLGSANPAARGGALPQRHVARHNARGWTGPAAGARRRRRRSAPPPAEGNEPSSYRSSSEGGCWAWSAWSRFSRRWDRDRRRAWILPREPEAQTVASGTVGDVTKRGVRTMPSPRLTAAVLAGKAARLGMRALGSAARPCPASS